MIYFGLLLLTYLAIGLASSGHHSYQEWRKGEDFTVSELWPFFIRIWLWPIRLLIIMEEREIGSIVLIQGSRSARMLRFLRDDGNDDEKTVD